MAKSNYSQQQMQIRQDREKRQKIIFIVELVAVIIASAIVAWMFFGSYSMQEGSMAPTIETGDRFLVNRVAYRIGGIHRGDLIAYRSKDDADVTIHVKRVIALPGETIQIKDGVILIDGKTYMENKSFPSITNAGAASEEMTIGDDEYFVLGDNRNNSEDSRFTDVGNIQRRNIIGKAWFLTSPGSRAGFLR